MEAERYERFTRVVSELRELRLQFSSLHRQLKDLGNRIEDRFVVLRKKQKELSDLLVEETKDNDEIDNSLEEIGMMQLWGKSVTVYVKKEELEDESSESMEPDSKEAGTTRDHTRPQRGTGWAGG